MISTPKGCCDAGLLKAMDEILAAFLPHGKS